LDDVGLEIPQPPHQSRGKPVDAPIKGLKGRALHLRGDGAVECALRAKRKKQNFVTRRDAGMREGNRLPLRASHSEKVLNERDPHRVDLEKVVATRHEWRFLQGMSRHPLFAILVRWAIHALGVFVAASIIPGITCDDNGKLIMVAVLLGLFNAFLKPFLVFFALPFVVLTLGAGILFINAFLFLLAASLVDGFHVSGFTAAFFGALIVSLINLFLGRAVGDPVMPGAGRQRPTRPPEDDVIDI
jgi:putative membrane protein